MSEITLVYPNQLYHNNQALDKTRKVLIIEDRLFFSNLNYHKQKLLLHKLSLNYYKKNLEEKYFSVDYITQKNIDSNQLLIEYLRKNACRYIHTIIPTDDWITRRHQKIHNLLGINFIYYEDPGFICDPAYIRDYFQNKSKFFFTEFYIAQRKRLEILLDKNCKPIGDKWTFDTDNRKKLPKGIEIPPAPVYRYGLSFSKTQHDLIKKYPNNYGEIKKFNYPINHDQAEKQLDNFLQKKLSNFGLYEDAISQNQTFIFHSVLTPALNIGLITPKQIILKTLEFGKENKIPINSLEGFIRQIIGWREYMRAMYLIIGNQQRTSNFFNFTNKIPQSFWQAKTGIKPIDDTILKTLDYGYCHHIERLMILGNFMLLCNFDPNQVYRWFMEMFIDAYDWVMVPNVYGMSQYADGGMITTKPYISGSNYIIKMSDYKKEPWCNTWDALYWNFIDQHEPVFKHNPRMTMMISLKNKLGKKLNEYKKIAKNFIEKLQN